jgi:hypothetical protein
LDKTGWTLIIEPMAHHHVGIYELTAVDLGDDVLLGLIRAEDPLGVLSIYLDGASRSIDRRVAIDIKIGSSNWSATLRSTASRHDVAGLPTP